MTQICWVGGFGAWDEMEIYSGIDFGLCCYIALYWRNQNGLDYCHTKKRVYMAQKCWIGLVAWMHCGIFGLPGCWKMTYFWDPGSDQ